LLTGAEDGSSDLREPSSYVGYIIPFTIVENPAAVNKGLGEDVDKGGKTNLGVAGLSNN